jgi:hypothetical protein
MRGAFPRLCYMAGVDLCFRGFEKEMALLRAPRLRPRGRCFLAAVAGPPDDEALPSHAAVTTIR